MSVQILLNLAIAMTWMFFHNSWAGSTFFIGYLLGALVIFAMRRFFTQPLYFRKVIAIAKLILLFLKELLISSLTVTKQVLHPRLKIKPGIIAVPTQLKTDWEITLFACLITLTPGTLTMEVSPEQDILFIHSLDIENAEEAIYEIQNTFERAIMEVTRK